MPDPDEIAAAADRLRRIRTENHLEVYRHAYGYLGFTKQKIAASFQAIREDRDLLADAYLAEHDPTPLTLDVLRRDDVLGEPARTNSCVANGYIDCYWGDVRYYHYGPREGVTVSGVPVTALGQLRRVLSVIREQEG